MAGVNATGQVGCAEDDYTTTDDANFQLLQQLEEGDRQVYLAAGIDSDRRRALPRALHLVRIGKSNGLCHPLPRPLGCLPPCRQTPSPSRAPVREAVG